DETAARARMDHELAANRDPQRPGPEHHAAWQHSRKTSELAAPVGDPRGQVEIPPWIAKEDLAEVTLAPGAGGPAMLRIHLFEQGHDGGDVFLGELPDPNHGDSARAGRHGRLRAWARAGRTGPGRRSGLLARPGRAPRAC